MASQEIVPFHNADMRLVFQQMGFGHEDRVALTDGMKYLTGAEADQWLEKRRGDLGKIGRAAEEAIRIQQRREHVGASIAHSTTQIKESEQNRQLVDQRAALADEQHGKRREELGQSIQAVRQQIHDEGRIALLSFTNPLAKKVWRAVANVGQHALNITVPILGIVHREALAAKCGQVATIALTAAKECATTLMQPSIYVPLAVATGVTLACSYAFKVGQRILRNEARAASLQTQIDQCDSDHRAAKQEFQQQRSELSEVIQKNSTSIEQDQKEQEELDQRGGKIAGIFTSVREQIMGDIAHRQLGVLKKALAQADQADDFVVGTGRASMMTVMDAMVAVFSERAQSAPALMGPASRPAIEES